MIKVQENVPLSLHSNYRIGGPAKFFREVSSIADLEDLSKYEKIFILGGGTNILFRDVGFDGLVIKNNIKGIKLDGNKLIVGGGELISNILNFAIENSLSGLEWAGGLPGTIGGAVRGNAGAFGGEIKASVLLVRSFNLRTKRTLERNKEECDFKYRWSVFKTSPDELIASVTLELESGDEEEIRKIANEKIQYRKNRHPLEYPNIGSTFKNIPYDKLPEKLQIEFKSYIKTDPFPVIPTTKLLALADLKGKRMGDAMISDKHPNFIVNLGGAKASDVLALIKIAKETIKEKWGIELEEEIMLV
ncbi:MAG TPA: UDP-N-acetylmuramate dehydrogenase [Patescibacteria group bacterium]|nr:UDP-N-acetylmuramate dehydrogenase [Patescibacteria group bacterium]